MSRVSRRLRFAPFAVAFLALAAGKPPNPADDFPIPPIPPEHPPTDQSAPVPDTSLTAPLGPPPSQGAQLRPDFFGRKLYNNGQGYVPGSTIEGQQEQREKPIPGVNLKLPLP